MSIRRARWRHQETARPPALVRSGQRGERRGAASRRGWGRGEGGEQRNAAGWAVRSGAVRSAPDSTHLQSSQGGRASRAGTSADSARRGPGRPYFCSLGRSRLTSALHLHFPPNPRTCAGAGTAPGAGGQRGRPLGHCRAGGAGTVLEHPGASRSAASSAGPSGVRNTGASSGTSGCAAKPLFLTALPQPRARESCCGAMSSQAVRSWATRDRWPLVMRPSNGGDVMGQRIVCGGTP